ncbi:DUF3618 domain-containing protein [Nocardioides sp. JQ2195]|uniref:DUF3618 domain-containing protein n=1 Tax=Nocardioides sp. JQ2195 TaxID=2592334 RepID=UPI00143E1C40|nr:DUF3618 domain-containing protein [Nocardioides sp. JQ2195]QIX27260.1 DUF3618 domain-containing protein [Nocardioides sp. JQ2195]
MTDPRGLTGQHTVPANGRDLSDPHELQRDIKETRERLGETVDLLSEKLDPRKQAAQHKQQLVIAGSAALVAIIALVVWRRRSS